MLDIISDPDEQNGQFLKESEGESADDYQQEMGNAQYLAGDLLQRKEKKWADQL